MCIAARPSACKALLRLSYVDRALRTDASPEYRRRPRSQKLAIPYPGHCQNAALIGGHSARTMIVDLDSAIILADIVAHASSNAMLHVDFINPTELNLKHYGVINTNTVAISLSHYLVTRICHTLLNYAFAGSLTTRIFSF